MTGEPLVSAQTDQALRLRRQPGPCHDEVDLDVAAGETLAVMGPSGCGKSTLLHLLGGLDRTSAGEVRLAGQPIDRLGERALARLRQRRVGFPRASPAASACTTRPRTAARQRCRPFGGWPPQWPEPSSCWQLTAVPARVGARRPPADLLWLRSRLTGFRPPAGGRLLGMTYVAAADRYQQMPYRRCGRSGIKLPEVTLGLWQNFGDETPLDTQRAMIRRAFDLGVTHFDLANNYGPPYGAAEINFGRVMREDLRPYRDELMISTKAGWDMWPGPYGDFGSRKYLLASLDQSLSRMGLEYVDIFYSHRADPDTPLEETMGALATAVQSGKALYAGISSYSPERTAQAAQLLRGMGVRLLIHQPSYSLLNRWIEGGLLDVLEAEGAGCIAFSPLAQGMLTSRYLNGIPEGSRASRPGSLSPDLLTPTALDHVRKLGEIAAARGQSLAQLAISWVLRDQRVTSALIGASSIAQLEENLRAVRGPRFTDDELAAIDAHAVEAGINLWAGSSDVT